jgi:plasmid stability protein
MANLTLSIDEAVLKRARIRALEQDTSVNALVREYLERLVAGEPARSGMAPFLALARSIDAGSGPAGRTWTRAELHER